MAHSCGDLPRDLDFRGRSEKYHIGIELINEAIGDGGETLRQPAFRGPVGGTGSQGDSQRTEMNACSLQPRFGGFRSARSEMQNNICDGRQFIEPADASKQLEIVIRLMRGNFAGAWNANGASQQKTASVARVSDAFRNSGTPSEPRGGESVLQKQGTIEMSATKFAGNIFHRERTADGGIEGSNSIREWLAPIKIGDPGTREN